MACRGAVSATTADERDGPAIERIAGVDVREATAEIEAATPSLRTGRIGPAQEMKRVRQLAGASAGYVYSAAVSAARPLTDYTARVLPHCDGVAIPLEDVRIFWQR